MSLTRKRVTRAELVMLPAHAIFSLVVGAIWILQSPQRLAYPSLAGLRDLWSVATAGYVLVAVGALIGLALLIHHRGLAAVTLGAGFFVYVGLAYLMADSAGRPGASYSAPAWPIYLAAAHLASLVSLALDDPDEQEQRR